MNLSCMLFARIVKNEVIISNIEGVKHEIDLRFHEFVEKTGKEPEYVECQEPSLK